MRMVIKNVDIFICQEYTDYDEKASLMREETDKHDRLDNWSRGSGCSGGGDCEKGEGS